MGRTRAKRLKGFGNAIVLPLAATFVEAVIDAFVDEAARLLAVTAVDNAAATPDLSEETALVAADRAEESAA